MAEWQSADFTKMLPAPVEAFSSTISPVIEGAAIVLGAVKVGLEFSSAFAESNPVFDFLGDLTAEFEKFRNDFLGTGWSMLPVIDPVMTRILTQTSAAQTDDIGKQLLLAATQGVATDPLEEIISVIVDSYDDEGDKFRPQFTGTGAAIHFLVGAPTLSEFIVLFRNLVTVFSVDAQLRNALERFEDLDESISNAFEKPALPRSTPPNWNAGLTIRGLFPPIANIIDGVFGAMESSMQAGKDAGAASQALIDAVAAKVDSLNRLVDDFGDLIASFDALAGATGVHVLYVDTTNGVEGLKSGLQNAANKPDFGGDALIAGFVVTAGGVASVPFSNIFSVFK